MTISSLSTLPLSLLESMVCGTFTSWLYSACTLHHTSVGRLKQVSFNYLILNEFVFNLNFFQADKMRRTKKLSLPLFLRSLVNYLLSQL